MTHATPRRTDVTRLPIDGSARAAEVARAVNALYDGHSENHGAVTLAAGTTETRISSPIFSAHTVLILVPTSADAAAIGWWQQDVDEKRAVTIGHDAPGIDVEFLWVGIG